jgi:hypothetical protein
MDDLDKMLPRDVFPNETISKPLEVNECQW